jgi:hypothetical protein
MTRFFRVNRDDRVPTREDQSNHHRSMKNNATYLSAIQVRRHFWVDQIVGDVRWHRISNSILVLFLSNRLVGVVVMDHGRKLQLGLPSQSSGRALWIVFTDLTFLTEPCCLCCRAIRREHTTGIVVMSLWRPVRNHVLVMSPFNPSPIEISCRLFSTLRHDGINVGLARENVK